jgi:hypothetical protein
MKTSTDPEKPGRSTDPETVLLWRQSPDGKCKHVWCDTGWKEAPFRSDIDFVKEYGAVAVTSMTHATALLEMADGIKSGEVEWVRPN